MCILAEKIRIEPYKDTVQNFAQQVDEISRHTESALVVAVTGDWGAGKTSFLKALESHYQTNQVPVVFYEAWRYAEDLHPLPSLIGTIREHLSLRDEILRQFYELDYRALAGAIAQSFDFAGIGVVGGILNALIQSGHQETSVRRLQQSLRNILGRLKRNDNGNNTSSYPSTRFVLLVDDLDRLSPPKAYQLIEVLRFYFDVDDILVVLGINPQPLVDHLQGQHLTSGDPRNATRTFRAYQFMEKVVHWEYRLFPVRWEDVKETFEQDLSSDCHTLFQEFSQALKASPLAELVFPPRMWIRIWNRCWTHVWRWSSGTGTPNSYVQKALKISVIQTLFPDIFADRAIHVQDPLAHLDFRFLNELSRQKPFASPLVPVDKQEDLIVWITSTGEEA